VRILQQMKSRNARTGQNSVAQFTHLLHKLYPDVMDSTEDFPSTLDMDYNSAMGIDPSSL